mmetsp:Transcript_64005/g.152624  ORF Transcript_64005/g.152624 Transcript_64005/m.152624 type:complete len:290 (+) Transcript_64005:2-871(+)
MPPEAMAGYGMMSIDGWHEASVEYPWWSAQDGFTETSCDTGFYSNESLVAPKALSAQAPAFVPPAMSSKAAPSGSVQEAWWTNAKDPPPISSLDIMAQELDRQEMARRAMPVATLSTAAPGLQAASKLQESQSQPRAEVQAEATRSVSTQTDKEFVCLRCGTACAGYKARCLLESLPEESPGDSCSEDSAAEEQEEDDNHDEESADGERDADGDVEGLQSIREQVERGDLPSVGSLLHLEGCCKRCAFFPKGTCENGYECEYCHFPHPKRRSKRSAKRNAAWDQARIQA